MRHYRHGLLLGRLTSPVLCFCPSQAETAHCAEVCSCGVWEWHMFDVYCNRRDHLLIVETTKSRRRYREMATIRESYDNRREATRRAGWIDAAVPFLPRKPKNTGALANASVCCPVVSVRVDPRLISSGNRGPHAEIRSS